MLTRQLVQVRKLVALLARGQPGVENVTAAVCGVLILTLMVVTAINVFGRKLFRHPLDGAVELSGLLLVGLFVIALGYVYRVRGHIGIEFIAERLAPRKRAIMELVTVVLMLPLVGFLTWQGVKFMIYKWDDVAPGLVEWPLWPFLVSLPLGFGFLGLRILRRLFEDIAELLGSRSEGETR